jgi:hypothetical protein
MIKFKKNYLIIIILTFLLTGCKNPLSSSKNNTTTNSSSSANTSKKTNSQSSNSGNLSSTVNSTNLTGTSGYSVPSIIVAPSNVTTPVKSSLVIQSGSTLYYSNWSDGNKLYSINTNGTGKKKLSDDSVSELILSNATINTLYYVNESDSNKLYSINTDGTGRKKVLDEKVSNLVLLGSYIYYIDANNKLCALDTFNNTKYSLNIQTRVFDSDGTNICYEDYLGKHALNSMKLDGSNNLKISNDAPSEIVVQSGVVYYSNGWDKNKLYKINIDGTNGTKLNDAQSSNLVFDSGYIYYINNSDFGKIYKIKIDGTNNTKLSDDDFVQSFSIAGNFIYYSKKTDSSSSKAIYKINK